MVDKLLSCPYKKGRKKERRGGRKEENNIFFMRIGNRDSL